MLSIVIPVFNEAESLPTLHRELSDVAAAQGYDLDVVFVDDGSTDGSWKVIRQLAEADPRVSGLRFRRNFGKAAALSAGFAQARGELVMTLDADLQDDPHEIPKFLAEMEKDLDVVSGWKKVRHDPLEKVLPSRVFNWMVSRVTGVKLHDHNCGMKCYRREMFDEVRLYGELHRFVPVLAAAPRLSRRRSRHQAPPAPARPLEVRIHPLRQGFSGPDDRQVPDRLRPASAAPAGHGRAGVVRPRRVGHVHPGRAGGSSRASTFFGLEPVLLHQKPSVIYSMGLMLLGGQLMSIGFLAELFIAYHAPDRRGYSISRTHAPAEENHERHARRFQCRASPERLLAADRLERRRDARPHPRRRLGRSGRRWKRAGWPRSPSDLEQKRQSLEAKGVSGEALQQELARCEERWREHADLAASVPQRQRPQPLVYGSRAGRRRHARRRRSLRHRQGDPGAQLGHDRHGQARRPSLFEQAAAAADADGGRLLADLSTAPAPRWARTPTRSAGSCWCCSTSCRW